jgi:DHA1 family bicyclomycin/chloramphenicol resistance-like MFS transporter
MVWTGLGGLLGIVVPLCVYMSSLNLIAANALACALEHFPQHAVTTAALFGAVQFGLGALAGMAVGYLHNGSPVPMAAVIAAAGILSWSAQRLLGHTPVIAALPADARTSREADRPEKQA